MALRWLSGKSLGTQAYVPEQSRLEAERDVRNRREKRDQGTPLKNDGTWRLESPIPLGFGKTNGTHTLLLLLLLGLENNNEGTQQTELSQRRRAALGPGESFTEPTCWDLEASQELDAVRLWRADHGLIRR
ncbi:hypothetical protein F5884DRAFT_852015 [Xylogone sp. PMI_703]|nr:hypothetical protein F5884DRAFT_852015 [Xylogone sp. PMI_703]